MGIREGVLVQPGMDGWMNGWKSVTTQLAGCVSVFRGGGDDGDMTSVHAVPHHQKSNP